MSIDMQEYVFLISRGDGQYDGEELEAAFLEELHAGKIERPHRIRGSSWGDDGDCGAFFFSLPAVVDHDNAFYVGMGRAVWGWAGGEMDDSTASLVKLPADWY